jgi:hypothetical protein
VNSAWNDRRKYNMKKGDKPNQGEVALKHRHIPQDPLDPLL